MKPYYQLAQLSPRNVMHNFQRPWVVVETFPTVDGPRSRVCDGRWETEQQARDAYKEKGITL